MNSVYSVFSTEVCTLERTTFQVLIGETVREKVFCQNELQNVPLKRLHYNVCLVSICVSLVLVSQEKKNQNICEFVVLLVAGWEHPGAQSLQWGGLSWERSVLLPQWLRHWTPVQLPGGRAPVGRCHPPHTHTHTLTHAHRVDWARICPVFTGCWKQWAGRSTQKTMTTSCLWQRTSWESSRLKPNRWALGETLTLHLGVCFNLLMYVLLTIVLITGLLSSSWRGTACRGTGLSLGHGVWPSTSPPGGVWRRQTSRRAPSLKPVAAARPQTTTTASNPNVALWNKNKNNNNHNDTTANTTSQQEILFLSHLCF